MQNKVKKKKIKAPTLTVTTQLASADQQMQYKISFQVFNMTTTTIVPVTPSKILHVALKKVFIVLGGLTEHRRCLEQDPWPPPPPRPTSKPISSSQDSLVRAYCTAGQGAGTLLTRERMMLTGWNAEGLQDGGRELFRPKAQEGQDASTHPVTVYTDLFSF